MANPFRSLKLAAVWPGRHIIDQCYRLDASFANHHMVSVSSSCQDSCLTTKSSMMHVCTSLAQRGKNTKLRNKELPYRTTI
jgi:hypothetical protein